MLSARLLRLAARIAPLVPIGLARRLAGLVAFCAFYLNTSGRKRALANLAHVPGLAEDPARLRWAARGVFRHSALNYLDFLRGWALTDHEIAAKWVLEGQNFFDEAIAQGRGMVVLSGHYGNFELGVSRLGAIGYTIAAPAERMQPAALNQAFLDMRQHHQLTLYPADARETLRDLRSALQRNELVTFLADRYVNGNSIELPFFGEPARLPLAPMALALRTGAPAMAIFCWREGDGFNHGLFVPLDIHTAGGESSATPASATGTGSSGGGRGAARARSEEAAAQAMRLFMHTMEQRIIAHPEQWVSALAPVWEHDQQPPATSPARSGTGAAAAQPVGGA